MLHTVKSHVSAVSFSFERPVSSRGLGLRSVISVYDADIPTPKYQQPCQVCKRKTTLREVFEIHCNHGKGGFV